MNNNSNNNNNLNNNNNRSMRTKTLPDAKGFSVWWAALLAGAFMVIIS